MCMTRVACPALARALLPHHTQHTESKQRVRPHFRRADVRRVCRPLLANTALRTAGTHARSALRTAHMSHFSGESNYSREVQQERRGCRPKEPFTRPHPLQLRTQAISLASARAMRTCGPTSCNCHRQLPVSPTQGPYGQRLEQNSPKGQREIPSSVRQTSPVPHLL